MYAVALANRGQGAVPVKKLLPAVILALLLFSIPRASWAPVEAFEPPYDRFLPQHELSPIVPAVKARNYQIAYRVENSSGVMPRWADQLAFALDTNSPYAGSYGRILSQWIFMFREDAAPVVTQRALTTAAFSIACNSDWAIGCAQWYTMPGIVSYRAPAMVTWSDVSVAAVIGHENHHIIAKACDQYRHGNPSGDIADPDQACRYENVESVCTGNQDSIMDCGNAARTLQPYDVDTFLIAYGLSRVTCSTSGWDECSQRWRFPDGLSWSPAPAPYGVWYKDDVSIFDGCDLSWGGRHSKAAQGWQRQGSFFFFDALNFGMETPIC